LNIRALLSITLLLCTFQSHSVDLLTGQHSLEFHGYFRGGLGLSDGGSTQAHFQAPGTRATYRLGNEADTNLELQLNYNYELNQPDNNNAQVQGIFMLDGYKAQGESNELSADHLAQAYLSFDHFFKSDTKVWLGRRYYDRKDINILDHTWLNPGQGSQAGFGIEDLKIGKKNLNIAIFRYEDNFDISGTSYLINSTNIDLRLNSINISSDIALTLWGNLTTRHEHASLNYKDESGYGLGGWVDYKTAKIKNTTAFIYQTGSAITQGDYNAKPVREDLGWDLDNASIIELSNTVTYQALPVYSVQWTLLFRHENHGQSNNADFDWVSTGARPVFYFSKHLNLAVEAGIDYIDDKINDRSGTLSKLTTALQISANRGFYSRPVMRFFVTFADWGDDFKGLIGNTPGDAPYADETQGWSVGAQAEVWW